MNIETYLKQIQADESMFPMDSFPGTKKKKKKNIYRQAFPESYLLVIEQQRVMIDLDKTIHRYSKGYKDGSIYDDPFKGAKDVINWLKNKGFEIVIFTTRASIENAEEMGGDHKKEIANIETWLKDNDIYFDKITGEKLGADFYIDDKAITIKDGNWNSVLKVIKHRMKFKDD